MNYIANLVRGIVLMLLISALTLGQSIFIEPLIGSSRLDDAIFHYGVLGNYGANLGIDIISKYDLYIGYKLMGDNAKRSTQGVEYDAEINFQTFVVGARYKINIRDTDVSWRLGLEYSYDSIEESVDYPVFLSDDISTIMNGTASGYTVESGVVLKKWKILRIFLGANYRFCNYDIEKTILNGETISVNDFESLNYLKTENVSGVGLKASVIVYPFQILEK